MKVWFTGAPPEVTHDRKDTAQEPENYNTFFLAVDKYAHCWRPHFCPDAACVGRCLLRDRTSHASAAFE